MEVTVLDPTILELLSASRSTLAARLRDGPPVELGYLADRAFRGIALAPPALFRPFGWRKFRKAFYTVDGAVRGYNEAVVDDALEEPWIARERNGRRVRYWPFKVYGGPGGAVIDYSGENPAPLGWMRDPLVRVGPGVLGVSVAHLGQRRVVTPTYFVLVPPEPEDR